MIDCYSLLITIRSQNTFSHRWNLMYLTLVLHGVGIFYNNHTHLCFVVVFLVLVLVVFVVLISSFFLSGGHPNALEHLHQC